MSESRTDILTWINNLLQLNVTKIEHLGTGAVYCQIIDSIYGKHACYGDSCNPTRLLLLLLLLLRRRPIKQGQIQCQPRISIRAKL